MSEIKSGLCFLGIATKKNNEKGMSLYNESMSFFFTTRIIHGLIGVLRE